MDQQITLSKAGTYNFIAEPFHCDFKSRLLMGHLGNNMLNAADYHSNERNYGMTYLNTIHKTWVLSRLAIEITEMPKVYDKYTIETWVDGVMRYFTSRNFKVTDKGGTAIGYGRSIWAMIDTNSRQPTDILAVQDGLIMDYVEKEIPCPIKKPSRVPINIEDTKPVRTIDTYYNDIDINGHVNSIKYIEHILDLWDLDWYKKYQLKRYEIAYVAESHQGDKLRFYLEDISEGNNSNEKNFNVLITKTSSEESKEVEVVRSYVKFVKD